MVIKISTTEAKKYLLIDTSVLPDVFEEVIQVKELLRSAKVKDITEAVKKVGISRSTYYKYKDYVFNVSDGLKSQKVTISILIEHRRGTLSEVLDKLAQRCCNILTINQDIPINNTANVNITFDISGISGDVKNIVEELKKIKNVLKVEIVAME
ncbi:chorismate mutase [Clostridium acetobutylicum]|nr:chorismate mutase [Clostridium acetobutylicum]NSA93840.1 chorismate mutase [Clostridium acetobutylicum]